MVQIRTTPVVTNKNTVALNENIQKLNDTLSSILKDKQTKTTEEKTSKKEDQKSLAKEIVDELKRSEAGKQVGHGTNILLGGLLGISPVLAQGLNLDKIVWGTAKYIKDDIKKRWAETGKKSNAVKVNSAVESNQQSGTHKRLDTIIGLLRNRKNDPNNPEDQEDKGHFWRFLANLLGGIFNSGVFKIVAALGTLGLINSALQSLLQHMGIQTNTTQATNVLAGVAGTTRKGISSGKEATDKIIRTLEADKALTAAEGNWKALTDKAKFTPAEKAKAMTSKKALEKIAKEKKLTGEQLAELFKAQEELNTTINTINTNFDKATSGKIGSSANAKNTPSALKNLSGKFLTHLKATGANVLGGIFGILDKAGPALTGLGLGAIGIGHGLEYYNAPNKEEKEEALYGGMGATVGFFGGAKVGAAIGAGIGAGISALLATTGIGAAAAPVIIKTSTAVGGIIGGLVGPEVGDEVVRMGVRHKNGLPLNMNQSQYEEYQSSLAMNEYSLDSTRDYLGESEKEDQLFDINTNGAETNELLTNIDESLTKILGVIGQQALANPPGAAQSQENDYLIPRKLKGNLWAN